MLFAARGVVFYRLTRLAFCIARRAQRFDFFVELAYQALTIGAVKREITGVSGHPVESLGIVALFALWQVGKRYFVVRTNRLGRCGMV